MSVRRVVEKPGWYVVLFVEAKPRDDAACLAKALGPCDRDRGLAESGGSLDNRELPFADAGQKVEQSRTIQQACA